MSDLYADIIVDISHEKLDRPFQYRIPEAMKDSLETGMCVMVPFGNGNKLLKGYVVGIGEKCNFDPTRIKDIKGIVKNGVEIEDKMIALAGWIRKNYGSTMIQSLKTVLPAKTTVKQLEHRTVRRLLGKEEIIALLGVSLRDKRQVAKQRLLQELTLREEIPYEWLTGKLGVSGQTMKGLENAGVIRIESATAFRNPVKDNGRTEEKKILSKGQQSIVDKVLNEYRAGTPNTYLIHGITGSGKTEVYIKIIEGMVEQGKQAIVLIPEIALTYQTLMRFYSRFGDRVSVMNSTLSAGEKYDQCQRAKKGEIDVIIGPRSALFTPFPRLGVIVIDEEHESSYKSESSPKYHARETAVEVARLHGASLVLGSATPSMESYYRAKKGEYKLCELTERLTGGSLPKTYIVDLRQELKEGNRSIFSRKLQELLVDRLNKGEQTILFLNRRGFAGFVSCRACGYVMKCPHCDVSLTDHDDGKLQCHYCGYTEPKPDKCPKCGSRYIFGFKAGTQQIEKRLQEMFPGVRTLRMDGDTTRQKESYERILSAFSNGEADVLIGTQMIVKGHDFPKVTLVGIIAADMSLSANEFRAGERTFQLLTQAVGRAGRGELPGEAVIQTYQPEHYAVVHAANQDYEAFYEEEILFRELGGYPPAAHLMAVQIFAKDEQSGAMLAEDLAKLARERFTPTQEEIRALLRAGKRPLMLLGPTPASIGKIKDIFRFVFYAKSEDYDTLVQIKDMLEETVQSLQLRNESVQFDFDPMNTM